MAAASRRILIPRAPERAGDWAAAVESAGWEPVIVPLIDVERPADMGALARLPERLRAAGAAPSGAAGAAFTGAEPSGRRPWLVITSTTTVRALLEAGAMPGLLDLRHDTVVAAVGTGTAHALDAEGLPAHIVPATGMNAQGLLAVASEHSPRTAFLPQSNLSAPTLRDGLERLGWTVEAIEAYRTVDAPADPARRLTARLASDADADTDAASATRSRAVRQALTPHEARSVPWSAALVTSPSVARRIDAEFPGMIPLMVSIGPSTSAELERLGYEHVTELDTPRPSAVVDLLRRVTPIPRP